MTQIIETTNDLESPTAHAMLVVWGHYAREIGLLERLRTVSIPQKRVKRMAPEKLVEFLIGILSGIEYLTDLSESSAPVMRDNEVAKAWELSQLADASGVSRTLKACNGGTLVTLNAVLTAVGRPFLLRAVADLRAQGKVLQLDADLTGRPVSTASVTFPGAAFGYMDGELRLGYQLAEICLHTDLYGRQWLGACHHPGDTVSAPCLLELIELAEEQLGCHPQRRTDLLATRLQAAQTAVTELVRRTEPILAKLQDQKQRITTLDEQIQQAQCAIEQLQMHPTTQRQSGRYSRSSRLQRQIAGWQNQCQHAQHQVAQLRRTYEHYQARLAMAQTLCQQLATRLSYFEAENAAQPAAPQCHLRIDAGFSSGENLTELIERGYEVETKSANNGLVRALRRRAVDLAPGERWTRVGKNAEMIAWSEYSISTCPYPLTVGLERFHTPKGDLYAVLIRFQQTPLTTLPDVQAWFNHYNARQTIEAGNKEEKTTFNIQHLMCRSAAGIQVQAMLTVFAANFVRWAAGWVGTHVAHSNRRFVRTLASPKKMVRIAANSPATVLHNRDRVTIRFNPLSSLHGVVITLPSTSSLIGKRSDQIAWF